MAQVDLSISYQPALTHSRLLTHLRTAGQRWRAALSEAREANATGGVAGALRGLLDGPESLLLVLRWLKTEPRSPFPLPGSGFAVEHEHAFLRSDLNSTSRIRACPFSHYDWRAIH